MVDADRLEEINGHSSKKKVVPWHLSDAPLKAKVVPWYLSGRPAGTTEKDDSLSADDDESAAMTESCSSCGTDDEKQLASDDFEYEDDVEKDEVLGPVASKAETFAKVKKVGFVTRSEINKPVVVKPWLRSGTPKIQEIKWEYLNRDEASIIKYLSENGAPTPAGIIRKYPSYSRGVNYPEWYYGFNGTTKIIITILKMGSTEPRVTISFGPTPRGHRAELKGIIVKDRDDSPIYQTAIVDFYYGKVNHLMNSIWKGVLDTDFFDSIRIDAEDGKKLRFYAVDVILNETKILSHYFSGDAKSRVNLKKLIENYRCDRVKHSRENSILYLASQQLGKAWDPKYFGLWKKHSNGDFYGDPEDWCSEFAAWVLRCARGLNAPLYPQSGISSNHLARFFMGLEYDFPINGTGRYLTPVQENKLCDPDLKRCYWNDIYKSNDEADIEKRKSDSKKYCKVYHSSGDHCRKDATKKTFIILPTKRSILDMFPMDN